MNDLLRSLHEAEIPWIVSLQGNGSLRRWMTLVSYAGWEALFYLMAVVFYCVSRSIGARLLALFFLGACALDSLKLLLHSPRPYWISSLVQPFSYSDSGSLPSGHALGTSVVFIFLAAKLRRPVGWAVAAAAILLVSISRVYLGVHFISDVVAGWLCAAALVGAYFALEPTLIRIWSETGPPRRIAFAVVLIAFLLIQGILLRYWMSDALDLGHRAPPSLEGFGLLARAAGSLLGVLCGAALATPGWLALRWDWRDRALSLIVAYLGAWIILKSRRLLPASVSQDLNAPVSFVFSAATAFWIIHGALWTLSKTGLLSADDGRSAPAIRD